MNDDFHREKVTQSHYRGGHHGRGIKSKQLQLEVPDYSHVSDEVQNELKKRIRSEAEFLSKLLVPAAKLDNVLMTKQLELLFKDLGFK